MKGVIMAVASVALVVAGISACGKTAAPAAASSPAVAPSPSPSPTINYQQQYLNDVAPSNAESGKLSAWSKANTNATWAEQATAIAPYYNDLITFGRELLQQQWPASAQADIHSLALAVEAEASDYSPKDIANGNFDQAQSGPTSAFLPYRARRT